jgi:hypothetical protein
MVRCEVQQTISDRLETSQKPLKIEKNSQTRLLKFKLDKAVCNNLFFNFHSLHL